MVQLKKRPLLLMVRYKVKNSMKIFVISLKESKNRRKEISKRMQELGLEFEFFDAVDGRQGLPKEYESMVDRNLTKKRYGVMSDGEYACALSHALLYEKIVEEKVEHAIILEDDCILDKDFANMVKRKELEKADINCVLLYHLFASGLKFGKIILNKNYTLMKMPKTPFGTVGYYIKRTFAQQAYEKSIPVSGTADWPFDLANMGAYAIYPRIVQHPTFEDSTLTGERFMRPRFVMRYGFMSWIKYKVLKLFSKKLSKTVDGK